MKTLVRSVSMIALVATLLTACSSAVKLDQPPVEDRTGTPVGATTSGAPGGGSTSAGTTTTTTTTAGTGATASQVTPVDLTKGGAANAAGLAGRVVYFDYDSFVVKDEFRGLIDAHARGLVANKGKRMMIEGHTDERGGREYNLALGQKRAEAVSKSLQLLGAGTAQVEAVSFGKERAAVEGQTEAAWAKNRRAELKDR